MQFGMTLIGAVAFLPTTAIAADPPRAPIGDEHRLSDTEVQKVLDAAALKRETRPAPVTMAEQPQPPLRPIEGEMGVAVGTGGYREAFGTAVIPLGQDGVAIISFDTVDSHRGKRRR